MAIFGGEILDVSVAGYFVGDFGGFAQERGGLPGAHLVGVGGADGEFVFFFFGEVFGDFLILGGQWVGGRGRCWDYVIGCRATLCVALFLVDHAAQGGEGGGVAVLGAFLQPVAPGHGGLAGGGEGVEAALVGGFDG